MTLTEIKLSESATQGITVKQDEGQKGRCVYSTRSIHAGEVLLREKALAYTLSQDHLRSHCSTCFLSAEKLFRCTGCQSEIHYCSQECQRADWKCFHRSECSFLKSMLPNKPPTFVRFLYRLCIAHHSRREEVIKALAMLISHRELMNEEQLSYFGQCVALLGEYGDKSVVPPASDVLEWCCKFATNGLTIADWDCVGIGLALYPHFALFNHSCAPSLTTAFEGSQLNLIALRDVLSDEELTQNYVDLKMGRWMRREELSQRYHFECECEVCSKKGQDDSREGFRCSNEGCSGWFSLPDTYMQDLKKANEGRHFWTEAALDEEEKVLTLQHWPPLNIECPKCRWVHMNFEGTLKRLNVARLDFRRLVKAFETQPRRVADSDDRIYMLARVKVIYDMQKKLTHKDNYHLSLTRSFLVEQYSMNTLWEEALMLGEEHLQSLRRIYSPRSPLIACQLLANIKLYIWLDEWEKAKSANKEALVIASKTGNSVLKRKIEDEAQQLYLQQQGHGKYD